MDPHIFTRLDLLFLCVIKQCFVNRLLGIIGDMQNVLMKNRLDTALSVNGETPKGRRIFQVKCQLFMSE